MPNKKKNIGRLPGDGSQKEMIDQMIRVNHAGEYGAVRIYEGQLAILRNTNSAETLKDMASHERAHLTVFNKLIVEKRVRPSALIPLWHVAGFALGAVSAIVGEKTAHACTVAVEEVIEEHYEDQIQKLEVEGNQKKLRDTFQRFRQEEIDHRNTALKSGAAEISNYALVTGAIKCGSRIAIWLSKKF